MIEVIPAIIPKDFEDLKNKISLVKDHVSTIQVDITDGVFVPSKSWPLSNNEDFLLPFGEEAFFEIDLMVSDLDNIGKWVVPGVKRVILHIESSDYVEKAIESLEEKVEVGVAFNIDTNIDDYKSILNKVNFIQFMGIEKIGFQGQEFSEEVILKIRNFREEHKDVIISVDGGVNLDNAKDLIEAGADRLVSGSGIFESSNIKEIISKLKSS